MDEYNITQEGFLYFLIESLSRFEEVSFNAFILLIFIFSFLSSFFLYFKNFKKPLLFCMLFCLFHRGANIMFLQALKDKENIKYELEHSEPYISQDGGTLVLFDTKKEDLTSFGVIIPLNLLMLMIIIILRIGIRHQVNSRKKKLTYREQMFQ